MNESIQKIHRVFHLSPHLDKCSPAVPIWKRKQPKLCGLTLRYDKTCIQRAFASWNPPTNEWKCCRPRESFPERAPLSHGWSSEDEKLLLAIGLSLPRDLARTDGLRGYKRDITPPLLLLLKQILPEIKSSSQLSTQFGKRTTPRNTPFLCQAPGLQF